MSSTDEHNNEIPNELTRLRVLVSKLESAEDERQEAEEALRESEERFRQLASSIHEVFWLVSLDKTQVFYISPAYEKVWGRSCESRSAAGNRSRTSWKRPTTYRALPCGRFRPSTAGGTN